LYPWPEEIAQKDTGKRNKRRLPEHTALKETREEMQGGEKEKTAKYQTPSHSIFSFHGLSFL
jgi:hypothetical protein